MDEEFRAQSFEEEFQDPPTGGEVQVEGPVDEFEAAQASVVELLHRNQKGIQWKLPHGDLQGAEAELASEGAPSRSLDVNHPVLDVPCVVKIVGQRQGCHIGHGCGDEFGRSRVGC